MRIGLALDLGCRSRPLLEQLDWCQPLLTAAEEYGFETVWAGETYPTGADHYPWFHASSSLLALAALAPRTSMQLGTAVVLAPAWHPLRLSYDATLIDQVSSGRLVMALGLGSEAVARRFGVAGSRVHHLTSCVGALRRTWAGYVSGPAADSAWPPPPQRGSARLLLAGGVPASARRAARLADGYYVGSSSYSLDRIERLTSVYRDARRQADRPPGLVLATRLTLLETVEEKAARLGEQFIGPILAEYARSGSIDEEDAVAQPAVMFARRGADTTLVGTPAAVTAQLRAYRRAGVSSVAFRVAAGDTPLEVALLTVRLLGEKVIPEALDM